FWLDGNLSGMGSAETRPPWHYSWMLAAVFPAIILSVAMLAGALRGVQAQEIGLRRSLRLISVSLFIYLGAFALLALRVPAYSQAKASYTLGLAPGYALLCVAGLDLLPRHWAVRSTTWAFLLCWAVLVFGTYFVT